MNNWILVILLVMQCIYQISECTQNVDQPTDQDKQVMSEKVCKFIISSYSAVWTEIIRQKSVQYISLLFNLPKRIESVLCGSYSPKSPEQTFSIATKLK